jgi:protein-L-isoaspartate O-methyltransferase
MPRLHDVVVEGIPSFVDIGRWLGWGEAEVAAAKLAASTRGGAAVDTGILPFVVLCGSAGACAATGEAGAAAFAMPAAVPPVVQAAARLPTDAAADVVARVHGLVVGGSRVRVVVVPPVPREALRAARLLDARRRRAKSPGFSRRGVRLDPEGRASLTPEPLARALAERLAASGVRSVLDVCAGAGGDAIAFARAGLRVVAVDQSAARLALLAHNAAVHGVRQRIASICADARDVVRTHCADVLYIDPPWAGAQARAPVAPAALPPLLDVLAAARGRFARTVLKLPPSFDVAALPGFLPRAVFGAAEGDARCIKMLLLEAP